MSDLQTEIKLTASADGVETGVARAKRSLADLSATATKTGADGGKGMAPIGDGAEAAAKKVDSATRSMQASLQRQIAALEAGGTATRQYQESIAKLRGIDTNTLKPLLDQLDAAKRKADGAGQGMLGLGNASGLLQGQLAALAGSLTLGSMAAFVLQINNGIDALNDIKDATGSTIENISALEDIGKRTGASLDLVGSVLIKFNNVLGNATPKSDIALQLQAIGLSAEELKRLDPAEALLRTAQALDKFADDGTKARLVQDLFGKSVKEAAPFLKDLAEKGELVAKVTTQQADEAERFNKELFAMQANIQEASRSLAGPFVTYINDIAKAFRNASDEKKGFFGTAWDVWRADMAYFPGSGLKGGQATSSLRQASGTIRDEGADAPGTPDKPSIGPIRTAAEIAAAKAAADAAAKAATAARERELAEQKKFYADMAGLSGDYYDKLARAQKELAAGNITDAQYADYVEQLIKKQPFAIALVKEQTDAAKALGKAMEEAAKAAAAYGKQLDDIALAGMDLIAQANDRTAAVEELVAATEFEATLIGKSNTERAVALKQYQIEVDLKKQIQKINDSIADQDDKSYAINAAKAAADKAKANAAAEVVNEEFQRVSQQIEQSLTDALMRGFESGKDFAKNLRDTVVNMFKTLVLRPVISAIVNPVAGAITGSLGLAGAANAGQGSSLLGTASNIGSLYNLGGSLTGIGGIASSASILSGSTYGTAALSQQSIMLAAQEAGVAVGSSTAASLSSFASAALPVAAAVAALAAVGAFRTTKTVGSGIMGTLGEGGQVNSYDLRRKSGYLFGGPDYSISDKGVSEQNKALQNAFTTMRTATIGMAGALGLGSDAIKGFTTTIGKELIHPDTGGLGLKFDGLTPEQTAAQVQAALADANVDMAQFVLMEMARAEVSPDVIAAARAAGDAGLTTITGTVADMLGDGAGKVGQLFGKFFGNVMGQAEGFIAEEAAVAEYLAQFVKDGETADQTLSRLSTSLTTVNGTFDTLGFSLESVSLAGADAASDFIDLIGGVEAFAAATAGYYANFYTETERQGIATEQLATQLGKLGQTLPTTRDGFRALIEAAEKAGDNALLAGLLNLQDEFAALVPAAEDAAAAVASAVTSLKAETTRLQRDLLAATGGDVRGFDTKGMSAAEVAIYDYNQSLRDQISAANAATQANEAAAEAARARAAAVAQERDGLNRQLLASMGDTAAIRALELAALDASNRAIQEHIWAIEDAAAAYEKATNAAQSAYSTLERSAEAERGKLTDTYTIERDAITERLKIQQQGYQAQIAAAQTAADKIRDIAGALSSAVGQVRVDSPTINRAAYDAARGVIGTGNINDPRLKAALQSVSGDNKQFYGKFEDYAFEQAVTAANIRSMDATAQSQLSAAEAMINSIKASDTLAQVIAEAELAALEEKHAEDLEKLQAQLDLGKSQLDALLGIDTSVLSVADAVAALGGAISAAYAAQSAQIAAATASATTASSGVGGGASGGVGGGASGGAAYVAKEWTDAELTALGFSPADIRATAARAAGAGASSGLDQYVNSIIKDGRDNLLNASGFNWTTMADKTGRIFKDAGEVLSQWTSAQAVAASEAWTNGGINGITSDELAHINSIKDTQAPGQLYSGSGSIDFGNVSTNTGQSYSAQDVAAAVKEVMAYGAQPDAIAQLAATQYGIDRESLQNIAAMYGIPGFATGINRVPRDMLAQIHEGEAVVPAQFNPYNPGASAPGNSEVVAELRQLNERMSRIEATNAATAGHTAATDRKLARVIRNDAMVTEALPA